MASTQKKASRAGNPDRRSADQGVDTNLTYLRIVEEVTNAGVTRSELGKAVGAAERTIQTWAAGTSIPKGVKAQRLLDIQLIIRLLSDTYTPEGIRIWLNSRNRNLDLHRPIELLEQGDIDDVLEEASRIAGG